jgi:hypothetical protein
MTHSLVNQFQCVMLNWWLKSPNLLQFAKNLYWLLSNLILELYVLNKNIDIVHLIWDPINWPQI